jgi:hypothetical protein
MRRTVVMLGLIPSGRGGFAAPAAESAEHVANVDAPEPDPGATDPATVPDATGVGDVHKE